MKQLIKFTTIIFYLLTLFSCNEKKLNGKEYVGYESEIGFHGYNPHYETQIKFKHDTAYIQQREIEYKNKKDFSYLNSIYTLKGKVEKSHDTIYIKAFAYNCNDCPAIEVIEGEPNQGYYVKYSGIIKDNILILNSTTFKLKPTQ